MSLESPIKHGNPFDKVIREMQADFAPQSPDLVNHPPHYTSSPARCTCGQPIECIQITEHMGFCEGNAVKYLWRSHHKGDRLEDLRKARWYLDREIARLDAMEKGGAA